VCCVKQVTCKLHLDKHHARHVQLAVCPPPKVGPHLTVCHALPVSTWTKWVNPPVSTALKATCLPVWAL
jgi:hypothetical protein